MSIGLEDAFCQEKGNIFISLPEDYDKKSVENKYIKRQVSNCDSKFELSDSEKGAV